MHSYDRNIHNQISNRGYDLKPRTKVASGNKTEIQVFGNHIPCPRILKLTRRNK